MEFFEALSQNKVVSVSLLSWAIAQILKVIFVFVDERKFDFARLVGAGGMPSSHAALVAAMSTSIGVLHGVDGPLFAISSVISLVIMYDASGVRRAAGEQARILNLILEAMNEDGVDKILVRRQLKELLGHTPFEVIVGAFLGVAVALTLLL